MAKTFGLWGFRSSFRIELLSNMNNMVGRFLFFTLCTWISNWNQVRYRSINRGRHCSQFLITRKRLKRREIRVAKLARKQDFLEMKKNFVFLCLVYTKLTFVGKWEKIRLRKLQDILSSFVFVFVLNCFAILSTWRKTSQYVWKGKFSPFEEFLDIHVRPASTQVCSNPWVILFSQIRRFSCCSTCIRNVGVWNSVCRKGLLWISTLQFISSFLVSTS